MLGCNESSNIFQQHLCKLGREIREGSFNPVFSKTIKNFLVCFIINESFTNKNRVRESCGSQVIPCDITASRRGEILGLIHKRLYHKFARYGWQIEWCTVT